MTTLSLTQTAQDCFSMTDLPPLEGCHTVIGSLCWSVNHLHARKSQRGIWGGVFCLHPEVFARDCHRHHRDFGLRECSFLGKDWRLDLVPFKGSYCLWQNLAMESCPGYAAVAEMERRFGFFYRSQALDSGTTNHLKVLETDYRWVVFREGGIARFWTFEPLNPTKDRSEETPL